VDDSVDSKSKQLRSTNIWTNNINNEVNDPCPTIPITNIIDIEHYDLRSNFFIQSHNKSNKKLQFLEYEIFTKSSYSMVMKKFEYRNIFR